MMEKNEVINTLSRYVDLSERDIDHISDLLIDAFPFEEVNIGNKPWCLDLLLTASAYLYSKCPGNSD